MYKVCGIQFSGFSQIPGRFKQVLQRIRMAHKLNRNLVSTAITTYAAALVIWTLLFYRNPYLKNVILDIHIIFSSTIVSYLIIRLVFSPAILDFIKVFIRTLFRVWLLIFITFAISRSMDRVGTFLSLTYILGYIEGLLDINKWLESDPVFHVFFPKQLASNKINHAIATIFLMTIIHILCAIVILIFYLLF